jgi:Lar family restriction alleviation protein
MNNHELKPCPFCGGEAKIRTSVSCYKSYAWGECVKCKASTKSIYDIDNDGSFVFKAIEAWNRRATE